jgi:hypothetical protein
MRYQFKHTDEATQVTLETDAISWPDLAESIYQFLLGCGFSLTRHDLSEYFCEPGLGD